MRQVVEEAPISDDLRIRSARGWNRSDRTYIRSGITEGHRGS